MALHNIVSVFAQNNRKVTKMQRYTEKKLWHERSTNNAMHIFYMKFMQYSTLNTYFIKIGLPVVIVKKNTYLLFFCMTMFICIVKIPKTKVRLLLSVKFMYLCNFLHCMSVWCGGGWWRIFLPICLTLAFWPFPIPITGFKQYCILSHKNFNKLNSIL